MNMRFVWGRIAAALVLMSVAGTALAWIYPEHRDIAVLAVEGLDPERKAEFDRLWGEARLGDEKRLCVVQADVGQGITPDRRGPCRSGTVNRRQTQLPCLPPSDELFRCAIQSAGAGNRRELAVNSRRLTRMTGQAYPFRFHHPFLRGDQ